MITREAFSFERKCSSVDPINRTTDKPPAFSLIDALPLEIILQTLSYLTKSDLAHVSQLCRRLNSLVCNHTNFRTEIEINNYKTLCRFSTAHLFFAGQVRSIDFDIHVIDDQYKAQHRSYMDFASSLSGNSVCDNGFGKNKTAGHDLYSEEYCYYFDEFDAPDSLLEDGIVATASSGSINSQVQQIIDTKPSDPSMLIGEILSKLSNLEHLLFINTSNTFKVLSPSSTYFPLKLLKLSLSASKNEYLSLNLKDLMPQSLIESIDHLELNHFIIDLSTIKSASFHKNPSLLKIKTLLLVNIQFTYSCLPKLSTLFPNVSEIRLLKIPSMCNFRVIEQFPHLAALTIDFSSLVFSFFAQYCYGYDFYQSYSVPSIASGDSDVVEYCYYDEVKTSYFLLNFNLLFSEYFLLILYHKKLQCVEFINTTFLNRYIIPINPNASRLYKESIESLVRGNMSSDAVNQDQHLFTDSNRGDIIAQKTFSLQGQNFFSFLKLLVNLTKIKFVISLSLSNESSHSITLENQWLNIFYPVFLSNSRNIPLVEVVSSNNNYVFSH